MKTYRTDLKDLKLEVLLFTHFMYEDDDKLSEQFNKAIIKLMNITIVAHDVNVGRIRNNLYNFLKMDLKNLIEYDFEF